MKRLQIWLEPAPALAAFARLADAASARAWPLSRGLAGALATEAARIDRALEIPAACVSHLARMGHALLDHPARAGRRHTRLARHWYAGGIEVDLDLRVLERGLQSEGGRTGGPFHATATAVYALLDALGDDRLLVARALKIDGVPRPLAEARARFAQAMAEASLHFGRAPSRADHRRAARAKAPPAPEQKPTKREQATSATRGEARGARRKTAKTSSPRRSAASTPRGTARAARAERHGAGRTRPRTEHIGGFGGLPDDAQPTGRASEPARSSRGLTLDAEFFLEHARIASWPCAHSDLDRGRKLALASLHPDRLGEGSTASFKRAQRGYLELVAILGATATPTDAPPAGGPRESTRSASAARTSPAPREASAPPRATATRAASGAPEASPPRKTAEPPSAATRGARPPPARARETVAGQWPPTAAASA